MLEALVLEEAVDSLSNGEEEEEDMEEVINEELLEFRLKSNPKREALSESESESDNRCDDDRIVGNKKKKERHEANGDEENDMAVQEVLDDHFAMDAYELAAFYEDTKPKAGIITAESNVTLDDGSYEGSPDRNPFNPFPTTKPVAAQTQTQTQRDVVHEQSFNVLPALPSPSVSAPRQTNPNAFVAFVSAPPSIVEEPFSASTQHALHALPQYQHLQHQQQQQNCNDEDMVWDKMSAAVSPQHTLQTTTTATTPTTDPSLVPSAKSVNQRQQIPIQPPPQTSQQHHPVRRVPPKFPQQRTQQDPEARIHHKHKFQAALSEAPNWGHEVSQDSPPSYDPIVSSVHLTVQDYDTVWNEDQYASLDSGIKWEEHKNKLGIYSLPSIYEEKRKCEKMGIAWVHQDRTAFGLPPRGGGGGGLSDGPSGLNNRFGGMRLGGSGRSSRYGGGGFDNKPPLQEGDWACPRCNNHNFAKRQECHRCQAPRPEDDGSSSNSEARGRNQHAKCSGGGGGRGYGNPNDPYGDEVRASSVVSRHRDSDSNPLERFSSNDTRSGNRIDDDSFNGGSSVMANKTNLRPIEFNDEASSGSPTQQTVQRSPVPAASQNQGPPGGRSVYDIDQMKEIGHQMVPEPFKDVPYFYVHPSPSGSRQELRAASSQSSQDPRSTNNTGTNSDGMPSGPSLLTRRPAPVPDANAPRPQPAKEKPVLAFLDNTGVYTKRGGPYKPPKVTMPVSTQQQYIAVAPPRTPSSFLSSGPGGGNAAGCSGQATRNTEGSTTIAKSGIVGRGVTYEDQGVGESDEWA
ncbi:UNVERIFIED_CONTAM: hypothetical protein HDU68_007780 [Siphonaria sp. JEL0065]|nr:hypothetical protein HDU68_007780 [Siphonaria sp. JEL0065]